MNFYSYFIHNYQNLEATKNPSVGECINCSTSIQLNIILFLEMS